MTDKALENAKNKRKQLLDRKRQVVAELHEIDHSINEIDQFMKAWHKFAEEAANWLVDKSEHEANKSEHSDTVKSKATGNSRKEEVADAARKFIEDRGEPIMRDELYDLLTAEGLTIKGKDPKMVLSTMLWRMRHRVIRLKSGGYWLAEVPNDKYGYTPVPAAVQEEVTDLLFKLKDAEEHYHEGDAPLFSDAEYNQITRRLRDLMDKYPYVETLV